MTSGGFGIKAGDNVFPGRRVFVCVIGPRVDPGVTVILLESVFNTDGHAPS